MRIPVIRITKRIVLYAVMIIMAIIFIFPFFWMVSVGIRSGNEIFVEPPLLLPRHIQLFENLKGTLGLFDYFGNLRNTVYVCVLGALGTAISSAMAAYAFARLRWRGKNLFFALTLSTMMLPFAAYMIPYYLMFQRLGLLGTLVPLWLPYCFGAAFNIFLYTQFFRTIPEELSDAARIDGCSEVGIFARIILPNSKTVLVTVFVFHVVFMWQEFLIPLIFCPSDEMYTLAVGLQSLQGGSNPPPWELQFLGATIGSIPLLIIFSLTSKFFVRGISLSGIKG